MNKIQLDIIGLSYSQTQSGAYVLLLSEKNGERKLPVIIGAYEAQAIAIELEGMIPNRPLTHDLFKSVTDSFMIQLNEVLIDELNEGIFHAKLLFEQNGQVIRIDARTSDAIAIAVRFKCPIYALDKIMDSAGILMGEEETTQSETSPKISEASQDSESGITSLATEQLQQMLEKAIEEEDYELASKIRDEINRRGE